VQGKAITEPRSLSRRYLVTGGAGFIGSAIVRRLLADGASVRVLDDYSRGSPRRLAVLSKHIESMSGDVRDSAAVDRACAGVDSVIHLAAVNGTEFFYSKPETVLEVGIKGMLNVIDAAIHHDVAELVVASSSEVYQTPDQVPTAEDAGLSIPDPLNPRYSYAGAKIASELLAVNYGRKHIARVLIFRPHNVYGPDMGEEHVIPQLTLRLLELAHGRPGPVDLPIQGSGNETRSFVFIDDLVEGVACILDRGEHMNIYHVGTQDEMTIAELARRIAAACGIAVRLVPSAPAAGGTPRRCPDISKLARLGYEPRVSLDAGLAKTIAWYRDNLRPSVGQATQ
jgi:nucleoside-diphosphate-sugar epimerase